MTKMKMAEEEIRDDEVGGWRRNGRQRKMAEEEMEELRKTQD